MEILEALIFDVDGTLAETEEVHREAFNQAFAEAGLDWNWSQDRYRVLLKTTGGVERINAHANEIGVAGIDAKALHKRKTAFYTAAVDEGRIELRPGVESLIRMARRAGIRLAIATTTSRVNVEALIDSTLGETARDWFEVMACGEDVSAKKPDPEVYEFALRGLGLPPFSCLALEDTANGVASARGAGLAVLVTPSIYSAGEDFSGASAIWPSLAEMPADDGGEPFLLTQLRALIPQL